MKSRQPASIVQQVRLGAKRSALHRAAQKLAAQAPAWLSVTFSRETAALCLWEFGEDVLSDRVMVMPDDELLLVQRIATVYDAPSYPLPVIGRRITGGHTIALAVVTLYEGLRPLRRDRRRPAKDRPEHLRHLGVD